MNNNGSKPTKPFTANDNWLLAQQTAEELQDLMVDIQLCTKEMNRALNAVPTAEATLYDLMLLENEYRACERQRRDLESRLSEVIEGLWLTPEIEYSIKFNNYKVSIDVKFPEEAKS